MKQLKLEVIKAPSANLRAVIKNNGRVIDVITGNTARLSDFQEIVNRRHPDVAFSVEHITIEGVAA